MRLKAVSVMAVALAHYFFFGKTTFVQMLRGMESNPNKALHNLIMSALLPWAVL